MQVHGKPYTITGAPRRACNFVHQSFHIRKNVQGLPEVGTVQAKDYMDDGTPIQLAITIDRRTGSAMFDFEGTGCQVLGNTNAPAAVTYSAVIYALRCLVKSDIPLNGGCLAPVTVKVR